jgi:hypothetical protein
LKPTFKFAINDDPDFLEEFEDDDSMPGLLETPHLASWYTQTMMTLVKPPLCLNCWTDLKMVRLMMTQMISPGFTCCQYGIWNLEGIKSYQKKIQRTKTTPTTDRRK